MIAAAADHDVERLQELAAIAEAAAREAGALLRAPRQWARRGAIDRDIKLDADIAAEQLIASRLSASYPVLGEEQGGTIGDGPTWIVDPLDGTVNFWRGIPLSSVSIALWDGGAVLGVVYDFHRDEMFSGGVGLGCRLNGVPVTVSDAAAAGDAILLTGMPIGGSFETEHLAGLVRQFREFQKVRLIGSAALSLAYVACGRADAYHESGIRIWDVAAGLALVAAAGGQYRISGDEYHEVTAAAPLLLNQSLFD